MKVTLPNQPLDLRIPLFLLIAFTICSQAVSMPLSTKIYHGYGGKVWDVWEQQNGLIERVQFSHNMGNIFTKVDVQRHPEWLPVVHGQRLTVAALDSYLWQPDLTLDVVAEHAARRALVHYHQGNLSFSVGTNDTTAYGDAAALSSLTTPRRWFRARPNYSDLVFTFTNRVAERISRSQPDKIVGCLAYYWHEDLPSFALHPQVMPYVCADRTQYYDEEFASEDLQQIARWGKSGARHVGLYDYAYGQPFLIPRICFASYERVFAAALAAGIDGWFVEMNPIRGFDAAKSWWFAQKMRHPESDGAALLRDFYCDYYGAAANGMEDFFQQCENIWMSQPGKARWIRYYMDPRQLLLFPPDRCRQLSRLLEENLQRAKLPVHRTHVEDTLVAMQATTAMSLWWHQLWQWEQSLENLDNPTALLEQLAYSVELEKKAEQALYFGARRPGNEPLGIMPFFFRESPLPKIFILASDHWNGTAKEYLLSVLQDTRSQSCGNQLSWLVQVWKYGTTSIPLLNPQMIPGATVQIGSKMLPHPIDWRVQAREAQWLRTAILPMKDSTEHVFRIEGADSLSFFQWVKVKPGVIYLLQAKVRGAVDPSVAVKLFLQCYTQDGQLVGKPLSDRLAFGRPVEEWQQLAVIEKVPVKADWMRCQLQINGMYQGEWVETQEWRLEMLRQ